MALSVRSDVAVVDQPPGILYRPVGHEYLAFAEEQYFLTRLEIIGSARRRLQRNAQLHRHLARIRTDV